MDMGVPVLRIVPGVGSTDEGSQSASSSVTDAATAVASNQGFPVLRLEDFAAEKKAPRGPHPAGLTGSDADSEDGQLVTQLLQGERSALERLYRRHAQFAFKLAVRLQGSGVDVEDIVHDAFIKAQARLSSLHDPAAFRGWLGSIVVNEVRLRLRRGRWLRALRIQSTEPIDLECVASEAASPEVRAQLAQVYALLRLMATEERIAWTLRFVERHRLEEVAELTGCSLATVKRRLFSAQRFLAEHLVTDRRQNPGVEAAKRGVL